MNSIYKKIFKDYLSGKKSLAILLDPDKASLNSETKILVSNPNIDYVFVGGSSVDGDVSHALIQFLKTFVKSHILLFPGDLNQLSDAVDAVLFLALLSGRNPDYLIGKHVASVPWFEKHKMEAISTAYILVDGNIETSTQRVTKTKPISRSDETLICNTAKASEILGFKCVYLEAGSGAEIPISQKIIEKVKSNVNLPLIVGGGIKTKQQIDEAHRSGADIVVIGNALEASPELINTLV